MTLSAAIFTTHLLTAGLNDGGLMHNQLVAVEHDKIVAATMINSYDRRSYVAAYNFSITDHAGLYAGAATGYNELTHDGVIPAIAPYYTHGSMQFVLFGQAFVVSLQSEF